MLRFRIPEICFGVAIVIAIFALGFVAGSSQEQQEGFWEAASDPTAVFTLCLVIVGLFQVGVFYVQLKFIRESLDDAKIAANAAKEGANAALRQALTAESAFTNLERPYIFIFGVNKLEHSRDLTLNDQPYIKYVVANYGKTPAIIESVFAGINTHPDEPLFPLQIDYIDDLSHSLLSAPILDAGERRNELTVEAPAGIDFALAAYNNEVTPQLTGQDQLFVWIIVKYRGPFTKGHESSACWRYYEPSNRLIAHAGSNITIPSRITPTCRSHLSHAPACLSRPGYEQIAARVMSSNRIRMVCSSLSMRRAHCLGRILPAGSTRTLLALP